MSNWKTDVVLAYNSNIYEMQNNKLKGTALGIWYVQIPNKFIIDPL